MKSPKHFIIGLLFLFFNANCFAMAGDAKLTANLGNLKKSLTELQEKFTLLNDKLVGMRHKLTSSVPVQSPMKVFSESLVQLVGNADATTLINGGINEVEVKGVLEKYKADDLNFPDIIANANEIRKQKGLALISELPSSPLPLFPPDMPLNPPAPQPKPVPPVVNPWQQIVDLLKTNEHAKQVTNPKYPAGATGSDIWKDMKNAIEAGNYEKVKKLMPAFGSSSHKYGKHNPQTFLKIAKDALASHTASTGSGSGTPTSVPDLTIAPISDTIPAWTKINDSTLNKFINGKRLWNPNTPSIRFYFPLNPNIKNPGVNADRYGNYFSNYSDHPVTIDGDTFATTEHYFQAKKAEWVEGNKNGRYNLLLQSKSTDPDEAKNLVNYWKGASQDPRYLADPTKPNPYNGLPNPSPQMNSWIKSESEKVMRRAIAEKVKQHGDVKQALKSTGDAPLLEHTVYFGPKGDPTWGIGKAGDGQNLLGIILMEERAKL